MDSVRGQLVSKSDIAFNNFRVEASFEQRLEIGNEEITFFLARRETLVTSKGDFTLILPESENRRGPVRFTAVGPDGLSAGTLEVEENDLVEQIRIVVATSETTVVQFNPDLTLGAKIKYTGRAIDSTGRGLRPNLLVVLWVQDPKQDGDEREMLPRPFGVARTAEGGYFSGSWTSDRYARAYAIVSGSKPVPLVLEDDRLPRQIILVADQVPEPSQADEACPCDDEPPRAPDNIDLAQNPETFAADVSRCVDFTVPNRTVEELSYYAVVRTTQPELKATKPPRPPQIPSTLIRRLAELARLRPTDIRVSSKQLPATREPIGDQQGQAALEPSWLAAAIPPQRDLPSIAADALARDDVLVAAVQRASRFAPGIALDGNWLSQPPVLDNQLARQVLDARAQAGTALEFETSVLAELAREPGDLTPRRLIEAEQTSVVRRFRGAVNLLASPTSGRFLLDEKHQIDWDEIPDGFQATTIAHGHLLQMKQVWRADGYSLGDLLYSLPLAPGQQKLISVLDWNREEVAVRRAQRQVNETLDAQLSHDRDVNDVIRASLSERMNASSHALVAAAGGGIGGFIGPVIFGAAGGVASASSTASQTSARSVTGFALNRVRDRTLQSASAVRSQRSTVVQNARQGEAVRAQTEVVANYNRCHAVTIEYFEVLRHLQVSQELAHVQECLFIPFAISPFNAQKALRWRNPLRHWLRNRRLRGAFDAIEREQTNWEDADFPIGRYADEQLQQLDGEFYIRINLPRPEDTEEGDFVAANWSSYTAWLWDTPENMWTRYLGVALPESRDQIWEARIAPGIAQRLLARLSMQLIGTGPVSGSLSIDPTLVSRFRQDRSLLVSIRANTPLPIWMRSHVQRVWISLDFSALGGVSAVLPAGAELLVESATLNYRTKHFVHTLFRNRRVLNDLTLGDTVEIATPISVREKRNPRERDRRYSERLLDHLNEHVEYYHRAIWLAMDPNRRFLLLDGFVAPDAGGRSVASVVENTVIGIVGNSLIMPVSPGQRLDSTYSFADTTPEDLRHLYSADPAPPMRISLPTSGVFAEAVSGQCNSCEVIDDTRFWRWEEAPIPDQPSLIAPLSLDSRRRTPPNLSPDTFPDSIVRLQTTPDSPDPTGLASAVKALGVNNIFKDLTGLALNQQNAANALKASIKAGQSFASKAGALAQQRFLNRELDRSLDHIKSARDTKLISGDQAKELTESVLRGAIGEERPQAKSPTKSDAIKRAMERVSNAKMGSLRVTRPEGSVEVTQGVGAGRPSIDVAIDPDIEPIQQPSTLTCWAAGGTMMSAWQARQSLSIETVLDRLGGNWREKFDRNEGLSPQDARAFMATLGLVEEGPQSYTPEGLARLLSAKGPLLEIGDDGIENNRIVHVRIITGVKGDGRSEGTTVRLADSATGQIISAESFVTFDRRHGATDAVRAGLGLFHF